MTEKNDRPKISLRAVINETRFEMGPAQLYSNKAEMYARSRPDFDPEAIATFVEKTGLPQKTIAADIGSGTGILTRRLLEHFETVYAVEPNDAMRRIAETELGNRPGFHSINSTAENIHLPDNRVDLITVGQAIHWFQPDAALAEFQRIAKPDAWLLLARIKSLDDDLNEALTPLWAEENGCLPKAKQPRSFDVNFSDFFADGSYQQHQFPQNHKETWESFIGGLGSASFAPDEKHPLYENFKRAAGQVFDQRSKNGILTWKIAAEISFGYLA